MACEQSKKRFAILEKRLADAGVKNCMKNNIDFLQLNQDDFPGCEAIICDPSCSGSGMVTHNTSDNELKALISNCTLD